MLLNKTQVQTILDNAPKGADKVKILDGLIQKGYDLEGVDSESRRAELAPPPESKSYVQRVAEGVKEDANKRADKFGAILKRDTGVVEKGTQLLGQGAGLAANAIETVVNETPGVKQALEGVGAGINWLATSDKSPISKLGGVIGSSKTLQDIVQIYDTDPDFKDTVDGVANLARLGLDVDAVVTSAQFAKNVTSKIASKVEAGLDSASSAVAGKGGGIKVPEAVKSMANDVVPTADRFISTEVTKALDLTAGDVKNIRLKTGHDVGAFLAEKNLIGGNMAETVAKLDDFYKTNYEAVRAEIKNVDKAYKVGDVPRYEEALKAIKRQVNEVPGLQEANAEIDALLSKKSITLEDVQRVKELMDDHFNLYKATGDVSEGVAKSGLANIRSDIRAFIEKEVKDATGEDIQALNNNVSTARSIQDAIEVRSTRGLTRATISAGDIVTFLTGSGLSGGNPLVGGLAVLAKKIYQSPTFKLRFSKWLDAMNDAKRLEIQKALEEGKLPPEIQIEGSSGSNPSAQSKSLKNVKITLAPIDSKDSIA